MATKSGLTNAARAAANAYDKAVAPHRERYNREIAASGSDSESAAAWDRYVAATRPAQAEFEAAIRRSRLAAEAVR